jgi:hypothetical protein
MVGEKQGIVHFPIGDEEWFSEDHPSGRAPLGFHSEGIPHVYAQRSVEPYGADRAGGRV